MWLCFFGSIHDCQSANSAIAHAFSPASCCSLLVSYQLQHVSGVLDVLPTKLKTLPLQVQTKLSFSSGNSLSWLCLTSDTITHSHSTSGTDLHWCILFSTPDVRKVGLLVIFCCASHVCGCGAQPSTERQARPRALHTSSLTAWSQQPRPSSSAARTSAGVKSFWTQLRRGPVVVAAVLLVGLVAERDPREVSIQCQLVQAESVVTGLSADVGLTFLLDVHSILWCAACFLKKCALVLKAALC